MMKERWDNGTGGDEINDGERSGSAGSGRRETGSGKRETESKCDKGQGETSDILHETLAVIS